MFKSCGVPRQLPLWLLSWRSALLAQFAHHSKYTYCAPMVVILRILYLTGLHLDSLLSGFANLRARWHSFINTKESRVKRQYSRHCGLCLALNDHTWGLCTMLACIYRTTALYKHLSRVRQGWTGGSMVIRTGTQSVWPIYWYEYNPTTACKECRLWLVAMVWTCKEAGYGSLEA